MIVIALKGNASQSCPFIIISALKGRAIQSRAIQGRAGQFIQQLYFIT